LPSEKSAARAQTKQKKADIDSSSSSQKVKDKKKERLDKQAQQAEDDIDKKYGTGKHAEKKRDDKKAEKSIRDAVADGELGANPQQADEIAKKMSQAGINNVGDLANLKNEDYNNIAQESGLNQKQVRNMSNKAKQNVQSAKTDEDFKKEESNWRRDTGNTTMMDDLNAKPEEQTAEQKRAMDDLKRQLSNPGYNRNPDLLNEFDKEMQKDSQEDMQSSQQQGGGEEGGGEE